MGKGLLIVILGSMILFGYVSFDLNKNLSNTNSSAITYYAESRTRDICNSTAEYLLSKLADNIKYRVNTAQSITLFGGTASYTVKKESVNGDSLLHVNVNAHYNGVTRTVNVYAAYNPPGWVPPFIRGAWTANGNLNKTISDMYIDGRNHKLDKSLIPLTGTYAVSTTVPFVNTENAEIGGTGYSGFPTDYPMTYPENPNVIELYNWGGNFPNNPDDVLGFTTGTLKSIAQSKYGGSQYVTDIKKLTYPLKGVTYIEPSNTNDIDFTMKVLNNTPNTGMLIVHRSGATSRLSGLKMDKADVPFVGLIVTDYSFHHHLNILGAIIQLSPNLELSKNCAGNKDHWVYFSRDAIINATGIAAMYANQVGNNPNQFWTRCATAGMGLRRWGVISWQE